MASNYDKPNALTSRTLHECVDWNTQDDVSIQKLNSRTLHECVDWNHPALNSATAFPVALYTSAWIEIPSAIRIDSIIDVALYTSAWIEMPYACITQSSMSVALYTSAWIEMTVSWSVTWMSRCRTLHECVDWNLQLGPKAVSRLRRTLHECVDWNIALWKNKQHMIRSHSTRVRGLKFLRTRQWRAPRWSHSTRVRGLKFPSFHSVRQT